jgi:hypothetical protein
MSVPLKRAAVGAALSCLLVVGVMAPAAIASAEELLVDDTTTTVVEEVAPEETAPEETAPEETAPEEVAPEEAASEETPAEEPATEEEPAEAPEPSDEAVAPDASRASDVPTPTATSTNDPDPNRLDPGEVLEVRYTVTGARIVHAWAAGDGLEVTLTLPGGGGSRVVADFGSYHQSSTYWLGMPDGVWTLTIRNIGDETVTPDYGLTYTTADSTLGLFSSRGAPDLSLGTNPVIGGVPSSDLVVHSQVTGPDGETYSRDLEPWLPGSTGYHTTYEGLPNGQYLARVWTVVDGVTYEESMTVLVHELETVPPVMDDTTVPAAPNAAGWFARPVTVTLSGSDAGSGFFRLFYTLDTSAEVTASSGATVQVTGDGIHTLTYRGQDAQENTSDPVERTIRIDATKPTVSLYGPVEGARYEIGEEVFAEYQCGDATSGIAECEGDLPDMTRLDTSTRGDFTFTVVATDEAGNVTREVRHYSVGPEDTTDPVVEAEVPGEPESGWYTRAVTVALTASDDDSGVARIHWEYPTESGTVVGGETAETAELTLDRTGEYQVTYWAEDAAGNRSEGRTLNLRVDVDVPEIQIVSPEGEMPSILPNGHYAQNEVVTVDFSCDDLGSGIDGCVGTTDAGTLLPTTTPGTHEFRVVATDLAGNRTENYVVYTVDAAPVTGGATSGDPANTPRLAQTGNELLIPGVVLVAVLLAAGAMLLASRRLGGR